MDRTLGLKDIRIDRETMSLIIDRITEIQAKGFGEITLYVRNGRIYRVKASSEDYIKEEDIPLCDR